MRTQGDILDQSIEEPDTWFDFLRTFDARFLDTQRDAHARTEIENLKLKDYNVDKYIQHFIALAKEASYDLREVSVLMKFFKGLPYCIDEECLRPPRPADFAGLVQRAQDTVSLYANMKQLYGDRNWQGGQNQNWHSPSQGQQSQGRPQWQGRNQQKPINQGSFGAQQYNSSNAPQHFNNTPVAMDMSANHNRMDRHWNPRTNRGLQANVASMDHPFKGKCFNCKKEGHLARDCTAPRCSHINMAHINDWATFEEGAQESTYSKEDDHLTSSIQAFMDLSLREKQEFMARMNQEPAEGEQQDFQKA